MVRSRGLLWKAPSGMAVMSLLWNPLQEHGDGRILALVGQMLQLLNRRQSVNHQSNRRERLSYFDLSCQAGAAYSQFLQFGQRLHRSGERHEAVEVKISGWRRQERTDVRAARSHIPHVQAPLNKRKRRPGFCQQNIPPDGGLRAESESRRPAGECALGGSQHLQVFDLSIPAGQHFSLIKMAALATLRRPTLRSDRSCPTAANVSEPSPDLACCTYCVVFWNLSPNSELLSQLGYEHPHQKVAEPSGQSHYIHNNNNKKNIKEV